MKYNILNTLKNDIFLLFTFWSILTAININKAFHINDTFHLEVAQWIEKNPEEPMSGSINWGFTPKPMHSFNQPPLFSYLIALTTHLSGYNEIPLHLLLSIFTFLGLFYFLKILHLLKVPNNKYIFTLFAFCPALIVNQNLMIDIPILAILLGLTYFLVKAKNKNKALNYCLSALLLGIGLLVKYSLLPVIIVFALVLVIRKHYRYLLTLLIPIIILGLWSYWNYVEFGAIHLFNKTVYESNLKDSFLAFVVCLGGISLFSIPLVYNVYPRRITQWLISLGIISFIASIIIFYYSNIADSHYSYYLDYCFFINGLIILSIIVVGFMKSVRSSGLINFIKSDKFVLFLFICFIGGYIVLYTPYIATRHILLLIPFLLIYGHDYINKAYYINTLTLILTISLGILLGISDWKHADYYRQMASAIDLPKENTIWTDGHWGWQWYSKKNGMRQYSINHAKVKDGDYLIFPEDVPNASIKMDLDIKLIDKKWKEADCLTLFSGGDYASLYVSNFKRGPWRLSKSPVDTILIYQKTIK